MAYTPATSQAEPAGAADTPDRRPRPTGRKLTVLLLALLWPAQMFGVANVFAANAQAQVAEHFHTTEIAWFSLIYALFGTLMTPFAVKSGDRFGKAAVIIGIVALADRDVITPWPPAYSVMLVGRAVAACYAPSGALVFATVRDVFPPKRWRSPPASSAPARGHHPPRPGARGWAARRLRVPQRAVGAQRCTAFALVLVIAFVPETEKRLDNGGFDWTGILLLGGSITALIYASQGTVWGWTSPKTSACWWRHRGGGGLPLVERRVRYPLNGHRHVRPPRSGHRADRDLHSCSGISYAYSGTLLAVLTL